MYCKCEFLNKIVPTAVSTGHNVYGYFDFSIVLKSVTLLFIKFNFVFLQAIKTRLRGNAKIITWRITFLLEE